MADISLAWNANAAEADWQIVNGTIATGSDLESAVIISLFTDRYAGDDYAGPDARGFWGDTFSPTPWGSRLWLLARTSVSSSTNLLQTARNYCLEALQWMLDDGVAGKIDVVTSFITRSTLQITINITEPTSSKARVFQYSWAWSSV